MRLRRIAGRPERRQHLAATHTNAIGCATLTSEGIMWQTIIHTIFILSALGIAWTDRVMNPGGASKPKH